MWPRQKYASDASFTGNIEKHVRIFNHPNVHVFGLWEEAGIPRESSWETVQMPHPKSLSPDQSQHVTPAVWSPSKRSPPPNALLCDSHQVSALGVNAGITLVSIHFPFSVSCTEAFHPFPFPAPRVRISPCLNAKSIIDSAQLPPPFPRLSPAT